MALEVIRHHRLLESSLAEKLGMPWDRVHDEAEVLEHHISRELEQRIADVLGSPGFDPHGDPIPDERLEIAPDDGVALTSVEPGSEVVVSRVSDSDSEVLRCSTSPGSGPGLTADDRGQRPAGGGSAGQLWAGVERMIAAAVAGADDRRPRIGLADGVRRDV